MRARLSILVVGLLGLAPLAASAAQAGQAAKPATPAAKPAAPAVPASPAAKPAAPQAKPPAASAPAPAPARPAEAQPSDSYTYDSSGRRDPFRSLLGPGTSGPPPRCAEGRECLSVAELSVRGVIQSRGAYIAMVLGPDGKTYTIHQGDKLSDGTVRAVNAEGLVVVVEVNDPLSLVKQREVSKKLRSLEAKE